jgi:hypothetical protein
MFVVGRNIFHKTKYREKTFESHACLISIFLFKRCDICKLELKAILRAIRGENRGFLLPFFSKNTLQKYI